MTLDELQGVLTDAIAALAGEKTLVQGAGRTDAGVHARGQVFHFYATWRHGSEKMLAALRAGLPPAATVVGKLPGLSSQGP